MISRVLIAGANGMLGSALQRVLRERGVEFVAPAERDFDITDEDAVGRVTGGFAASGRSGARGLLVNAAAFTNVEAAEDDRELAYRVNEYGARVLATAARDNSLQFVHVSTDFVFDGTKETPYSETDDPNPLSVYGASKLAGETAVLNLFPDALIVRTAWVYGPGGVNFPVKIMAAAQERESLQVVTDEIGSPTYTVDLAAGILELVGAQASGLYHLAGAGSCSRYELASEILRLSGRTTRLEPVTSDVFPTRAARPGNSVLDCSKAAAMGVTLPGWHDGLSRFLGDLGENRATRPEESDAQ
ncbi:MAG: dTDP-4-dehydrorhamnose reductase [Actinobacteria bacterium HGW-Actinobacteria-10]|nr:MAG: dTDP-4-dehydrorhamnose reductase [Actinobacteria bacterium HGW-Actinobacteria-10]